MPSLPFGSGSEGGYPGKSDRGPLAPDIYPWGLFTERLRVLIGDYVFFNNMGDPMVELQGRVEHAFREYHEDYYVRMRESGLVLTVL